MDLWDNKISRCEKTELLTTVNLISICNYVSHSIVLISLSFTFFLSISCFGQQLNMDDSIILLEELLQEDLNDELSPYTGTRKVSISVKGNELTITYRWENNKDVLNPYHWNKGINYTELIFNTSNISGIFKKDYQGKKAVALRCKKQNKSCCYFRENAIQEFYSYQFFDQPNFINDFDFVHLFYLSNSKIQERTYNRLNYILSQIDDDLVSKTEVDDIKTNSQSENIVMIPLNSNGGVSYLEINLGGYQTKAILDSGASDLSINEDVEKQLLKQGLIKKSNYLSPSLYRIANNSVIECRRFIIPFVMVGKAKAYNVKCSVGSKKGDLLLGGSFLRQFQSFKVDNKDNKLIIEI